MIPRTLARAAVAAFMLGAALLLVRCRTDAPPPPEPPDPAVRQADGSLLLERTAPQPDKPPHQLPKGSRVERRMQITAKPKADPRVTEAGELESAPVTVDLSLLRLADDTRRVVASSPDGDVVGGLDIPAEPVPELPEPRRWAAGVYVNPIRPEERGLFVDRDFGRLRVGAELGAGPGRQLEARVKIGLTF